MAEFEEYEFLVTRSKYHQKKLEDEQNYSKQKRKTKFLTKFVSCGEHKKTADKECGICISFPAQGHLPYTRLPTGLQVQVLGYYFNSLNEDETGNKGLVMQNVVADIMNHWIGCNVYTTTRKTVKSRLETLLNTYNSLKKKSPNEKGPTFINNLKDFNKLSKGLFDIRCTDISRVKKHCGMLKKLKRKECFMKVRKKSLWKDIAQLELIDDG